MKNEKKFITDLFEKAYSDVVHRLDKYTDGELKLTATERKAMTTEITLLKKMYFDDLTLSTKLAKKALTGKNANKKRIYFYNPKAKKLRDNIESIFHQAGKGWILNGLVIKSQRAGIKRLAGLPKGEDAVIDVLNSAASLALGGENPWLLKADRTEDLLGLKDNVCVAYHPGLRQGFALSEFAKLYPGKKGVPLAVHSESSGSVVDSIAIESVVAFAEKGETKLKKILAIDGTWAGAHGTAREGTGFGIDAALKKRTGGKSLWVDRVLPAPTPENRAEFIKILKDRIAKNDIAGLYLEPDNIGDLGIIPVDKKTILEAKTLLGKANLPIIADCVQQLGRTGGYWGVLVEEVFADYPLLVVTTAKSAANGQPFGYVIMPKVISDAAHPLSMVSTNEMNGPLLRALVTAEVLKNKQFQKWVEKKGKDIEEVGKKYGFEKGENGLRGSYLSRAVYVGDNETVKIAQIALLLEDGVLTGALPKSIRYQPMLFEYSEASKLTAEVIFKKTREILDGKVSKEVMDVYESMKNVASGLARET